CNGRKFSTATVENFLPQQENFLPQQRWQWGGWLLSFSEFPEGKIHHPDRGLDGRPWTVDGGGGRWAMDDKCVEDGDCLCLNIVEKYHKY
ncbi:MAG: hypothetical protein J7555_05960, partial [Chloroflexi bacterium]|nr:hypothetical protein [Chloroflexota bacterium]